MKYNLILVILVMIVVISNCKKFKKDDKITKPEKVTKGVTTITYQGWPNSIQIANDSVKIVVVPAIGRIMYYGLIGGDNVLWNNPQFYGKTLPSNGMYMENGQTEWANFGGDKVWPTEQSQFPAINGHDWPPDHWFDGGEHTAVILENGVEITSPVSDYCGARSIRTITLENNSTRLTIQQKIEKVKQAQRRSVEPISYTIWNVTQINPPEQTLFSLNTSSIFSSGYKTWSGQAADNFSKEGNVGIFIPHPVNSQKAGADGDKWLAAIIGNVVMAEFFTYEPGEKYPDDGCSAEVYTSRDYTELELLSPFARLSAGQSTEHTIYWELKKLPNSLKTVEDQRQAAVSWLNKH
ncbi:DUF4380 domain-containing protein [candidate division KSB1 bacterium]|nr:DUF4380 domain-containing protein [candidate division KSB1 bacterium]